MIPAGNGATIRASAPGFRLFGVDRGKLTLNNTPAEALGSVGGDTHAGPEAASLPLLVLAVTLFVWLSSGRFIATDNAYVKGDRAQIATEVSGIIVEVPVKENQAVSRGQLLFKLDDQSYRLALIRLEAEIETGRAEIRGLRAQWRVKREEIKAAIA